MGWLLPEQEGKDEEDGDDGGDHAAYDDSGERLLGLRADAVRDGGGQQTQTRGETGHQHGADFVDAAVLSTPMPSMLSR